MQEWLKRQLSPEARLEILASSELFEVAKANAESYFKIVRALKG